MPSTKAKPRASSGEQGRYRIRPRRASRQSAGPHRQQRPYLQHSERWQLRRHRAPRSATRPKPGRCGAKLRRSLSAPATRASSAARRLGKPRVRQRSPRCGRLARFGHIEVEPGSSGYDLYALRQRGTAGPRMGDWQPLKDGAAYLAGRPLSAVEGGVATRADCLAAWGELSSRECGSCSRRHCGCDWRAGQPASQWPGPARRRSTSPSAQLLLRLMATSPTRCRSTARPKRQHRRHRALVRT